MPSEVPVSLSTLCGGELEKKFQDVYPGLIAQLREGNKASISINIDFKKVPDTTTMVTTTYKLTPKVPGGGRSSMCQIAADFKLKTEAPPDKPKVVGLFNNEEQGGNVNE